MSRIILLVLAAFVLIGFAAACSGETIDEKILSDLDRINQKLDQVLTPALEPTPFVPDYSCLPDTLEPIFGREANFQVVDISNGLVSLIPEGASSIGVLGGAVVPEENVRFEMKWLDGTFSIDEIEPVVGISGLPFGASCFNEEVVIFSINVGDYCEHRDDIWARPVTERINQEAMPDPCATPTPR